MRGELFLDLNIWFLAVFVLGWSFKAMSTSVQFLLMIFNEKHCHGTSQVFQSQSYSSVTVGCVLQTKEDTEEMECEILASS